MYVQSVVGISPSEQEQKVAHVARTNPFQKKGFSQEKHIRGLWNGEERKTNIATSSSTPAVVARATADSLVTKGFRGDDDDERATYMISNKFC